MSSIIVKCDLCGKLVTLSALSAHFQKSHVTTSKICIYCKHYYFFIGEEVYEGTLGVPGSEGCYLFHWRTEEHDLPKTRLENLERGLQCKDFVHYLQKNLTFKLCEDND